MEVAADAVRLYGRQRTFGENLVAFTRPDNTLPLTRAEAEAFHAHAYIMAVKCYQPQLSFDIRPKEPFWNNIHAFPMTPMCFTGRTRAVLPVTAYGDAR